MNNLNIRYKCLDARDDYNAQKKKIINLPPTLFNNDIHIPGDVNETCNDPADPDSMNCETDIDYDPDLPLIEEYGPESLKQIQHMKQMSTILINSDWFTDITQRWSPSYPHFNFKATTDWKKVMQSKQSKINEICSTGKKD